MSARFRGVLYLLAGMACLPGLAQAQTDGLKHDPFARPLLVTPPALAAPALAAAVKAPVPEAVWKPELRAIILAGAKSIVNVGGALVGIGEQINGYRLVEVREETAVFANGKNRVTLSLRATEPLRPPRQDEPVLNQRRDPSPRQDDRGATAGRGAVPSQDDRGRNERRDDAAPSPADRGAEQPRNGASKQENK